GEHHDESPGVWLVLAKKGTSEPTSLTYEQALEEALCHGWSTASSDVATRQPIGSASHRGGGAARGHSGTPRSPNVCSPKAECMRPGSRKSNGRRPMAAGRPHMRDQPVSRCPSTSSRLFRPNR